VRHHSQGASVVGTDLQYFAFRGLRIARGRMFTRLGDCVAGSRVAAERGLEPGGSLFTTPDHVFDIAGEYPLKMRVTGVLAESGTPDDHAIFCDVKTAWLIEGRAHGHDDLVKADASQVLKRDGANVVGNASVRMYQEVTDANLNSFHFHGDVAGFPISAAIILPADARAEAILAGRHAKGNAGLQILRPMDELSGLLDTIFRIEGAAISALLLVGLAAAMVATVVFALSFKLRRREFATLEDIGVRAGTLRLVKLFEMALVLLAASVIAVSLVACVTALAPSLINWGLR
jgi:putative ABC transport system permease protein